MKKIWSIVILAMLIVLSSSKTFAFSGDPLERVNYLDLAVMEYNWRIPGYASSKHSIQLKPNAVHTLVLSRAFLGQDWDYIDLIEIELEETSGANYYCGPLSVDQINQRAYYTFTTIEGLIDISKLPVNSQHNYEAMIYAGEYEDFPGFVPYAEASEPTEYFGYIPLDYDNLPSTETLISYVNAKNPSGGIISKSVIFDDYSASSKLPGSYQMVFETEFNQIRRRYYLDVRVFDLTAPTLFISGALSIPVDEKWSIDQIKEQIVISDNADLLDETHLSIVSDSYTGADQVGSYLITFKASDLSGNTSTLDVTINLIDQTGPVIKGPSDIYLYTSDTPLKVQEVLDKLIINDAIDGLNVNVTIHLNEYNQTIIPGQYRIHVKATDSSDNVTIFIVKIHVIENRGPVFEHSELVIDRTTADEMSESEIIDWLKEQLNLLGYHATEISVLYNEYDSHEKKEGSYYVYLSYKLGEEEVTSRVRIDVKKRTIPVLYFILPIGGVIAIGLSAYFIIKHKKN